MWLERDFARWFDLGLYGLEESGQLGQQCPHGDQLQGRKCAYESYYDMLEQLQRT